MYTATRQKSRNLSEEARGTEEVHLHDAYNGSEHGRAQTNHEIAETHKTVSRLLTRQALSHSLTRLCVSPWGRGDALQPNARATITTPILRRCPPHPLAHMSAPYGVSSHPEQTVRVSNNPLGDATGGLAPGEALLRFSPAPQSPGAVAMRATRSVSSPPSLPTALPRPSLPPQPKS